jgi:hypothetical protein
LAAAFNEKPRDVTRGFESLGREITSASRLPDHTQVKAIIDAHEHLAHILFDVDT